jgi:hypothetical protein
VRIGTTTRFWAIGGPAGRAAAGWDAPALELAEGVADPEGTSGVPEVLGVTDGVTGVAGVAGAVGAVT